METILAFVIGALYTVGFYLLVRRSVVKMVFGLALLSHAANLLIFSMGGLVRGRPPLVPLGGTQPVPPVADPLPQALILTAIVIGFGLQAFALVLIGRTYRAVGSDDTDVMTRSER
jgi:multicomponent Na+:H+ antiporter subunit C